MRVFYPQRIVERMKALRVEGWQIETQVAEPELELILWRDGTPRAPQLVVASYPQSGGQPTFSQQLRNVGESVQVLTYVRFSRTLLDGFDVELGDRFVLNGQPGSVNQIVDNAGRRFALGVFDSGEP